MNDLTIQDSKVKVTELGIEFRGELTFDEWDALGRKISRAARCIGFLVGDWINYGEGRYGEMYLDALNKTGFDYQTLRNFAWVAKAVQLSVRTDKLTWEHHKMVAKLAGDDQRVWLEAAQKQALSTRRLRKSIIKGRVLSPDEMHDDPADRAHVTYLVWINRLCQWWRKRIDQDPLEKWEQEDRAALKRDLEPLVRLYEQL